MRAPSPSPPLDLFLLLPFLTIAVGGGGGGSVAGGSLNTCGGGGG